MAETLGSLFDKLTIIKLKQWHTDDKKKLAVLNEQQKNLEDEINNFIFSVINGDLPINLISSQTIKIYNEKKNVTKNIEGSLAKMISEIAYVNCELWHEQEKVYDFENVPAREKNKVVKKLALLNLERNKYIDLINLKFKEMIDKN